MYVGMRVQISGLASRADLNGTVGVALSFESAKSRYAVETSSGEQLALKAANLSLAPDEPAAAPTPEDDRRELLECARYGEEEELSVLLSRGVPAGYADDQGTTALHRAAANGHVACVRLLAAGGCPHAPNASGNLPLHWAVQQGHIEATRALLQLYPDADVLAQNSFGKSVSSEAFARGDAALVELVLAHSSAAKLEPEGGGDEGGGEGGGEGEGGGTAAMEGEVTHTFRFGEGAASPLVHVRELGELGADDQTRILGATADYDRTGLQLWAASIVLSRWLVQLADQIDGRGVIELGAGCGLCGIVAARLCGASHVCLTDLATETMDNLRHNLDINGLLDDSPTAAATEQQGSLASTLALDWRHPSTWPPAQPLVIGADLIYADEAVSPLLAAVDGLVAVGGAFLYVAPETNRRGETAFLSGLCARGWECQRSEVPPAFLANAFDEADGSEDDFYLLFAELKQRTYTLYCYTRIGERAPPPLPRARPPAAASQIHQKARDATGGAAVELRISALSSESVILSIGRTGGAAVELR